MHERNKTAGFTIVELLIVIVVIGILAAITVVAFNGMRDRAIASSIASDLSSAAKQLRSDNIVNDAYPSSLAVANGGRGITASNGTALSYSYNNTVNPRTFTLTANNGPTFYMATESMGPKPNLARNASSPSSLLTDGVIITNPYYQLSPGLQSVTVTLPSVQDVSAVKVWHYFADGRTYNATRTDVSEDGVTWTTVFDSAVTGMYPETSAGRTTTFSTQKVRYVRDWLNGSTANTGNHWVEIQAY